ncbi:MAG: SRPBCC domain-containing protein [Streptosporangiaceae bacterium]
MNLTAPHAAVRLERTIPAPPGQVYRAWLDPGRLARWMNPGPLTVSRAEVDERVGGYYRIWHADASGAEIGGFDCELTELVPGQRIVFRWGFVGAARRSGPAFDSRLTVTLREAPGGATQLTLVHERLDDLAAALPDVAANVGPGWDDALAKLAGLAGRDPAGPGDAAVADLSLPEAEDLLRWQPLARLAYSGPDGFPRVVPVGFLWRDGQLIVCTATTAPKVRALSARPHVALTIDTDNGTGSRELLVRGVASTEIVDGVPAEYLEAAAKTMPAEQHQQFAAQVRSVYPQMARISIAPRWARYFDFGAGRVPEFLRQLGPGR